MKDTDKKTEISTEFLKKIRRIQITTSRMVSDVFAGQYHSVFKGSGMEFSEVREYMPGDEIRSIDWNVTARTGKPHIKKFTEERELTVMLLLDVSSSCFFGTVNQLKSQLAAEICSVLAFSAIQNNDKVGLLVFTDKIEKLVPAKKGTKHVLRVIREALCHSSQDQQKNLYKKTDLNTALQYLNKVVKRRAVVFIISDFYAFSEGSFNFKKQLSVTNKHHDVISVTITDPRELELPDSGILGLNNAETGEKLMIDSTNLSLRNEYKKYALQLFNERQRLFRTANIDNIDIRTDVPYSKALIRFFRERERRVH